MTSFRPGTAGKALWLAASLLLATRTALPSQSLTTGGLTATVLDERGTPLNGVSVTLERNGAPFLNQSTDSRGTAIFRIVAPGRYSLLVEQLGYRPLRNTGLLLSGGGMATLTVRLSKGTPGNTVEEQEAVLSQAPGGVDRLVTGTALRTMDRRRDLTNLSRSITDVDAPRDGRDGFALSANGLPASSSSLIVDGIEELLLRHGGLKSEPATAPLFGSDAFDQARVVGFGRDIEYGGTAGALLTGSTRAGSGRAKFLPWLAYSSAKLGGRTIDNPADSSGSSFEGGFRAGGGIKGDTGSWTIRADYRNARVPTANPFETAAGGTDPTPAIRTAVQSLGRGDVSAWLAPTVRIWTGGSVLGRFDWQFNRSTSFSLRSGMASWTETNPLVGNELVNGAGGRLEAKDFSLAGTFTTSGDEWISETRLGIRSGNRDWSNTTTTPYTGLVGDNVALGGSATVPGLFKESQIELSEAYSVQFGAHAVKVIADFRHRRVTDDWVPYEAGHFDFGDVAAFAAGRGAFVQTLRSEAAKPVAATYPSLGVQDSWQASPRFQITAGARLESQKISANLIPQNIAWAAAAGVNTALQPQEGNGGRIGPRVGLVWTSDASGRTTFRADAGLVPVHFDLAAVGEAMQYSGGVTVRRATGDLPWPNATASSLPPVVGPSLTFFNAGVKSPRSFKGDASLTQRLGGDLTLTLHAGYDHTEYLLRRADLNLIQSPLSSGSFEQPIYGMLEQYDGMLTPAVGSNRRFRDFDKAYMLSSSGFADYTEMGVALDRQLLRGLNLNLEYTWSKTRDNIPGQMSNELADQLSPFPGTTGHGSWDEGRSDFDVPNRAVATLAYTSGSFSLSARGRYRSGLPFTPGFQRGVDANGDGATGNDPAPLANSIPGMPDLTASNSCLVAPARFLANRNSCRDPAVHSLDLHLGVTLPFGRAHPVSLLVDAFNVIATNVGIFDHAAVLVDPTGSLNYNSAGQLVLPLKANDNFGQPLSRRGEARTVRIGFRVEN